MTETLPMAGRLWLQLAALFGLLGVACGAFGAHALKARLSPELLAVWKTAVDYQLWHVAALLAVGLLAGRSASPLLGWAGVAFTAGIVVFSGSLYALALSGVRVLGAITPLGGLGLMAGWVLLGLAVTRG